MNVDRTVAAAAYSDLLTVWQCDVHCLLQEGEGHRLTDFLHASWVNRHPWLQQILALWNANTHIPSITWICLDIFAAVHIWPSSKNWRGHHYCTGSMFCGFQFVALQQDIYSIVAKWMDNKQQLNCRTFDNKMMYGQWCVVILCVQKDLLYFHLEKKNTSKWMFYSPKAYTLWKLIYCFFETRFRCFFIFVLFFYFI